MPTLPISLRLLREVASRSDHNSYLHVAAVIRGGVLLSLECNQGSHHAECRALEKLWPSERKGTTVYSLRFTMGHKRLALAKPCPECEKYMRRYGIKKVIYSSSGGDLISFRLRG
jgi:deoxycytidylate deaminase